MDNYLTSANVWAIVWIVIGLLISLGGSLLCGRFLFPAFSDRCAHAAVRPVRCGLLGLATAVLVLLVLVILRLLGPAAPAPMFLVGGAVILTALAGGSGLVVVMARRMAARADEPADSWLAHRRAVTVLTLTFLLPVAGWFMALPLFLLVGLGAAVSSLRTSAAAPVHSIPPPPP